MDIDAKLAQLGLVLPPAPKPVAAYVPAVRAADLVFISGQLPTVSGKLAFSGLVGREVSLPDAQSAARHCALNALAVLKDHLQGDWSRLARIVRLGVFVACADGFCDQSRVANGASELLVEIFGDAGRHARAAVGVNALPLNAPVELDLIAAVKP